ncbi:MAG: hypothetical protein QOE57_214, partial [Acidimicrobiaceae bacterium]|nr:hypothetical protein [Acidimicrobiaceae bacterium]
GVAATIAHLSRPGPLHAAPPGPGRVEPR